MWEILWREMPVDGMVPVASRGVPSSENTPVIIMEKALLPHTGKLKEHEQSRH